MRSMSTGAAALLVTAVLALPAWPAQATQQEIQPAVERAPKCKGRQVTILGTQDADVIRGSNQRDVILSLGGDDRVDGRGGDDVICGGAGRDLVRGGPGHDKIFGGADGRSNRRNDAGVRLMVGDVVQGGPGDDLMDPGYDERQQTFGSAQRDRLSYKDSAFRVIVTLGTPKTGRGHSRGDGRDRLAPHPYLALLGSNLDDQLTGSAYGDQVLGRGGADRIDGLGGRDVLVDGPIGIQTGDDELVGGIGRDRLTSYGGHDQLDGGPSADLLTAGHAPTGPLSLSGGRGGDVFTVGGMVAGACVDAIGGGGTDELLPTVPRHVRRGKVDVDLRTGAFGVRGQGGDGCGRIRSVETLTLDNVFGDARRLRWFVRGTSADETVVLRHGGSVLATMAGGADRVTGSSGDDNLKGGPGDDRLFGGGGRDVAIGGPGKDTCRKVEFRKGCEVPA